MGQAGRAGALGGKRPMGTAACGGKGFKERTRVSGERPIGAASFRQQSMQSSSPRAPSGPPCPRRGDWGPEFD